MLKYNKNNYIFENMLNSNSNPEKLSICVFEYILSANDMSYVDLLKFLKNKLEYKTYLLVYKDVVKRLSLLIDYIIEDIIINQTSDDVFESLNVKYGNIKDIFIKKENYNNRDNFYKKRRFK